MCLRVCVCARAWLCVYVRACVCVYAGVFECVNVFLCAYGCVAGKFGITNL